MIYHTGFLAHDREKKKSRYSTEFLYPGLHERALKAYEDYVSGRVILFQRKVSGITGTSDLPVYEYHSVRVP